MLKLTLIGCQEHMLFMPNKLEISLGFHGENFYLSCFGCLTNGFMWKANTPQHIFLSTTWFDNQENKIMSNSSFCIDCATAGLAQMKEYFAKRKTHDCYCHLCSFVLAPKKPHELLNSPEPLTICFCALSDFEVMEKLSQEINDYRKDEYARKYKNLSGFGERMK